MKITHITEATSKAVIGWAASVGWKTVSTDIAEEYHAMNGGDLLPKTTTENGIGNVVQRVKRVFQNVDGPRYGKMATDLTEPALKAMPTMRRCAVTRSHDPVYLAAIALKEVTEFVNVVNLGGSERELLKEGMEAKAAMNELCNQTFIQKRC